MTPQNLGANLRRTCRQETGSGKYRDLEQTRLATEASGADIITVAIRRVNIGQTVVASLSAPSLFLLAKDLTHMQVWVAVNEADIGNIRPGQRVTFTVDAFPGKSFEGKVNKVRLNASMTDVAEAVVDVVDANVAGEPMNR